MKESSSCYLRAACFGIVCLFASSLFSMARAADALPGSPGNPLTYEGPQPFDRKAPDGHLMFSPDVQNIQIYRSNHKPSQSFGGLGYTFAHHVGLGCWKGLLYAVWDANLKGEDILPTRLLYATSADGFHWSEPKDFFPPGEGWNLRFYFYHASNDTMLAFAAAPLSPTAKTISESHKTTVYVREITADHQLGQVWTLLKPRPSDPPSFDTSKDTRFVAACREAINNRPLLEQQDYGQLLGDRRMKWHDATNWPDSKIGGISKHWTFGKALCFFHRQDGALVGLSKLGFVTLSSDGGNTWSFPVIPKGLEVGTGKIWGQRTDDDRYALAYNPWSGNGPRFPLAITMSDDGIRFHDLRVIHGEVPPQRYHGSGKTIGAHYVRGITEWGGDAPTIAKFEKDMSAMWVIYSVNEEDIWISRIATPVMPDAPKSINDTFDDVPVGPRIPNWHTYAPSWTQVAIAKDANGNNKYLELADSNPVDYARAIRTISESNAGTVSFQVEAVQSNRGRMEIDLLGNNGARPVQIVLNEQGNLDVSDGGQIKELGIYPANSWINFAIQYKDGKFTLKQNDRVLMKDAAFVESSPRIYAISFRTGKYRGTVENKSVAGLPNTENPTAKTIYRIDNVSANSL